MNELIFESLEKYEQYLDENLPRDLAKAYKNSLTHGSGSQRHPDTRHKSINYRRSVLYDYGKANYEEMTADEAIEYVKENKENIENLRVIFNGELVEFEVRNNGTVYAIYGSDDRNVMVGDKEYKNIRFAPYKRILQNANKIYVTDEYDHPISQQKVDARKKDDKITAHNRFMDVNDPDYNPHAPYNNFNNPKHSVFTIGKLDSGDHNVVNRYEREFSQIYKDEDTVGATYKNTGISIYHYDNINSIRKYIDKVKEVNDDYIRYDRVRKALNKLEREKDDYDEDEYKELHDKWSYAKHSRKQEYDASVKEATKAKDKIFTRYDAVYDRINVTMTNYLQQLQQLLIKAHQVQKKYDEIVSSYNRASKSSLERSAFRNQMVNPEPTPDTDIEGQTRRLNTDTTDWQREASNFSFIANEIDQLTKQIQTTKKEIEQLQERCPDEDLPELDIKRHNMDLLQSEFVEKIENLDDIENTLVDIHIRDIKRYERSLNFIRKKLNKIEDLDKSGRKTELDPSVSNLIDFGSFVED